MTAVKTSVKKWIWVLSNLIASVWTRSICQMQATFPGGWILKDFIQVQKEEGIRRRMSTSSMKRPVRRFHVVVVQWTSKKCTKKRDARAELLFWSLNLLFFWSRRCGRRRSCLSSLILTHISSWAAATRVLSRSKRDNPGNEVESGQRYKIYEVRG